MTSESRGELPQRPASVARRVRSNAAWVLRAGLDDYLIAVAAAPGRLPFIGAYLEPVGGIAALGVFGARYLPDFMASARVRLATGNSPMRRRERLLADSLMADGLRDILPADELQEPWPVGEPGAPWRHAGRHRSLVHRASVPYGDAPGQVLDVWRRPDLTEPAPVLVFLPGGAWVIGSRVLQGHALMAHLAERGWVCLSVQYRTSPRHRWPRQIIDVKSAIAWARVHAGSFGGDTSFVAVAGCSAGGHMAALAGLTAGEQQWETTVDTACDTSVDAVVSIYGCYDWEDRSTPARARFMDFLERVVVRRRQSRHPAVFHDASPMARLHASAPPFLVIHGASDAVIPVGEARSFVDRLRRVSTKPVGYVELPGAGHGFDLTDAARTSATVNAVGRFLDHGYRTRADRPVLREAVRCDG